LALFVLEPGRELGLLTTGGSFVADRVLLAEPARDPISPVRLRSQTQSWLFQY